METQTETEKVNQPEPPELVRAHVTLSDSRQFKALVKFLFDVVSDEIVFKVDEEGIHVLQMDPSRVSMTKVEIPKWCCEEFYCQTGGIFVLNVERLLKRVVKRINKDETVTLDLAEGKLTATLKARLTRVFGLPLLDLPQDYDEPPLPKLAPTVQVKLITTAVKEILQDIEDTHVKLTADSEQITFEEKNGDMLENFHVTLKRGSDSLLDIENKRMEPGPVKSHYSKDYLKSFVEGVAPLTDILTLSYGTDMPIQLKVQTASGYEITFWLAPRIYGEDD